MGTHHDKAFPNESAAYRAARDGLLEAERGLRRQMEEVAALRRELPLGGEAKDYEFQSAQGPVTLSGLFEGGKDTLLLYGFMFAPGGSPCPLCTAFLDSLNGAAPHISQRVNLTITAKASVAELNAYAEKRGWNNLRLVSWGGTSYGRDYFTEDGEDEQQPVMNVFVKKDGAVRHFWGSELLLVGDAGMHPRHLDTLWPLWAAFDLTPEGRGTDWFPATSYD